MIFKGTAHYSIRERDEEGVKTAQVSGLRFQVRDPKDSSGFVKEPGAHGAFFCLLPET
jgi:hypothetical protein